MCQLEEKYAFVFGNGPITDKIICKITVEIDDNNICILEVKNLCTHVINFTIKVHDLSYTLNIASNCIKSGILENHRFMKEDKFDCTSLIQIENYRPDIQSIILTEKNRIYRNFIRCIYNHPTNFKLKN